MWNDIIAGAVVTVIGVAGALLVPTEDADVEN